MSLINSLGFNVHCDALHDRENIKSVHVCRSVDLAEPGLSSSDNKMGALIEAAGIETNLTLDKPCSLTVNLELIDVLTD